MKSDRVFLEATQSTRLVTINKVISIENKRPMNTRIYSELSKLF